MEGLREAAGKDYIWVAIRCSPFHTASAFHPIIEHLKRVFGWQPEDTAPQHLAKLEAGLGGFNCPAQAIAYWHKAGMAAASRSAPPCAGCAKVCFGSNFS